MIYLPFFDTFPETMGLKFLKCRELFLTLIWFSVNLGMQILKILKLYQIYKMHNLYYKIIVLSVN